MPVFHCQFKGEDLCGVVSGENAADALLKYDEVRIGHDNQNDLITEEAEDCINTYCEQLLLEYDVTELHRHDVLEYVERRLDGDERITILL